MSTSSATQEAHRQRRRHALAAHNARIGTGWQTLLQRVVMIYLLGPVLFAVVRLRFRVQVSGAWILDRTGDRGILAFRHFYEWDPFVVWFAAVWPRAVFRPSLLPVTIAAALTSTRMLRCLSLAFGLLGVRRGDGLWQHGMKRASALLEQGEARWVAIAPTGPIGDRDDAPIRAGVGLLAARHPEVPVVPLLVEGLRGVRIWEFWKRERVVVRFGLPIHSSGASCDDAAMMADAAPVPSVRGVMQALETEWAPDSRRDEVLAAASRRDPRATVATLRGAPPSDRPASPRALTTLEGGRLRTLRVAAALVVGLPTLGAIGATMFGATVGYGPADVGLAVGFYVLSVFGITGGYHRFFSHRSYQTSDTMKVILGVLGALAWQGPVLFWVAEHRCHHAHADLPEDPHSPVAAARATWRGLVHAHVGWMFGSTRARSAFFAQDLKRDPTVLWLNKYYAVFALGSLAAPALAGLAIHGTARGALGGLLLGGLARICVAHHVTWLVNSYCHAVGLRPFATDDESRNSLLLAPLTMGESLHNSHHAFPWAAAVQRHWYELDLTGAILCRLERWGVVWGVRRLEAEAASQRSVLPRKRAGAV